MTERALQRQILERLRKRGGVWVNKSPSQWDRIGLCDIIGCERGGRFVAIELKAPGRYTDPYQGTTAAQALFLKGVDKAGGIAIVADSWETVQECLERGESNVVSYPRSAVA